MNLWQRFKRLNFWNKLAVVAAVCTIFGFLVGQLPWNQFSTSVSRMYNLWARKAPLCMAVRVGILNDMGWDLASTEIYSATDISPELWKREIEEYASRNGLKVKVKLIDAKENFDSYIVILNPYGSVYPEYDDRDFVGTMTKIFKYVNEGGIFVNIADVPGYWAYDPLLKRRVDTTPLIYDMQRMPNGKTSIRPVRLFKLTPFMKKLELEIFNTENTKLFSWDAEFEDGFKGIVTLKINRVVAVEKNVEPVIKPRRDEETGFNLTTPFFFASYGEGNFLISLVSVFEVNNKINSEMKKILAGIIIEKIKRQIKKKND